MISVNGIIATSVKKWIPITGKNKDINLFLITECWTNFCIIIIVTSKMSIAQCKRRFNFNHELLINTCSELCSSSASKRGYKSTHCHLRSSTNWRSFLKKSKEHFGCPLCYHETKESAFKFPHKGNVSSLPVFS